MVYPENTAMSGADGNLSMLEKKSGAARRLSMEDSLI
jgi:hypothetical protein